MFKIFNIINKNIKLLIRSKTSALIVIFGPLLVILLIGVAFNTSSKLYDINIGIYSDSYSELSEELIMQLSGDQFIIERTDSSETCINSVKTGEYHVCMVIPTNLQIVEGSKEDIKFYVDYSRVNLVWIIIESLSKKISTKTSEISIQLTQKLLDIVSKTEIEFVNRRNIIYDLSSNNQKVKGGFDELKIDLGKFNSTLGKGGFRNLENITEKIEGTNLTEIDMEFVLDTLSIIENQLSGKLKSIDVVKQSIDEKSLSIGSVIDQSSSNIEAIGNAADEIAKDIRTISIKDAEKIVSPIKTTIEPIETKGATFLSYMFPTLLVLIIMFVSIVLSATLVIREKTSNAFFRNFITPTNEALFVIGNFLTNLLIVVTQILIILGVLLIIFKGGIIANLHFTLLALLLISTVFILIGMLIGYIFKSEETATLGAISVASIFLFFSNAILPIESLPSYIRKLANFNPFILGEGIIRRLMLFQTGFNEVARYFLILGIYVVILAVFIWVVEEIVKESHRLRRHIVLSKFSSHRIREHLRFREKEERLRRPFFRKGSLLKYWKHR